jgi:hypothetical protein
MRVTTSELINKAVKIGTYRKSNDGGMGIVSVVEGDILNTTGEAVYHFGTRDWNRSDSDSEYEEEEEEDDAKKYSGETVK